MKIYYVHMDFSHLVSLWSFDEHQRELDAEIRQAAQLGQTRKQRIELIDLWGESGDTSPQQCCR